MGGFRDGPLIKLGFWFTFIFVLACAPPVLSCDSQLNPLAFAVNTYTQNTLLPNGMMAIRYPETDQEISPHVSVHRVMMVMPGLQTELPESKDIHYRVVEVDGTVGWMTYLLSAHALFYGVGEDSLGFPERMWIDPEEDGINGNEHLNGISENP